MIVGGYSLDLYCDYPDDSFEHMGLAEYPGPGKGFFFAETGESARKQARQVGWSVWKGKCLCPYCKKLGRTISFNDE